jgi:hypothetical protein
VVNFQWIEWSFSEPLKLQSSFSESVKLWSFLSELLELSVTHWKLIELVRLLKVWCKFCTCLMQQDRCQYHKCDHGRPRRCHLWYCQKVTEVGVSQGLVDLMYRYGCVIRSTPVWPTTVELSLKRVKLQWVTATSMHFHWLAETSVNFQWNEWTFIE